MASLRGYLPPAGSTVWRNDRRIARTSSCGEGEHSLSRTRIKHIVIREVWKKNVPSLHALYKVDVMTQSNHWFILRRYREFHSLHQNLVKHYNVPSDMLPSKKFSSNMSLSHLEKRRNALEHYLQRLINSHHDIAESQELFAFLNVQTHDVLCVTRQLARVLEREGRNILARGGLFTFTPTQMYCITRQLQLPHCVEEPSASCMLSNEEEEVVDLGYLYSFVQELKSLCVSGLSNRSSPCQELISNQAFDISLFKSLEKLQIDKCHISVIDGLHRIQKQLTHVTVKNCLRSMKVFLVDCAMQKRTIHQANSNVESWRNVSTTKLTDNRVVVRPWILLTHVNMSHNKISSLDHSLKLLPALEQLDLSYNEFAHLDLKQLASSSLTFLNMSYNIIHYISATPRDLRNLKSLLLSHNKLQSLDGLDCLRGLVELDVRDNQIRKTEELVKISSLLHLRILALTGNPCVAAKSHRINVFSQLKARELILDGVKITEGEKKKMQQRQDSWANTWSVQSGEVNPATAHGAKGHHLSRKKVESDRDDDQDSGFGGNYVGSIDDGGLVFDWGCYSSGVTRSAVSESFEDGEASGPSTSWHGVLTSSTQSDDVGSPDRNKSLEGSGEFRRRLYLNESRSDRGKEPVGLKQTKKSNCASPTSPSSQKNTLQTNAVQTMLCDKQDLSLLVTPSGALHEATSELSAQDCAHDAASDTYEKTPSPKEGNCFAQTSTDWAEKLTYRTQSKTGTTQTPSCERQSGWYEAAVEGRLLSSGMLDTNLPSSSENSPVLATYDTNGDHDTASDTARKNSSDWVDTVEEGHCSDGADTAKEEHSSDGVDALEEGHCSGGSDTLEGKHCLDAANDNGKNSLSTDLSCRATVSDKETESYPTGETLLSVHDEIKKDENLTDTVQAFSHVVVDAQNLPSDTE